MFKERSTKKELLDGEGIPFTAIAKNMKELGHINLWLGGHAITIKGFKYLLKNKKQISVCEIGCGGGDNLKVIDQYCRKHKIHTHFTGIDINKYCIEFAKQHTRIENVKFITSDYKKINFEEEKPEIIFCSLFCHHFTDEQLVGMLLWMKDNSSVGFFINDLQRHYFAYHSIKWITTLFSKSYLVKNDAPLSVLRGFIKKEWEAIFKASGIKNFSIKWQWAFRYLIIVDNKKA